MKSLILSFACVMFVHTTNAQFFDNFSDGDFTQNPTWTGDTSLFRIDNFQLRLNSSGDNDSTFLVTPSSVMHNTEWNFWVRLAFTPSDNNHPKIYLVSNSSNLRGPLNGYYIQVGKTGGDNKRIYMFRQDGLTRTEIMAGADNLANTTNNQLRIRVVRNNSGVWEIFADAQGGNLFVFQGTVTDATHINTSYFGVFCKYTSSNATRFYFDDFYVEEIETDTIPSVINLTDISVLNNEVFCYSATDTINVQGLMVYSGGIITLIAGESILLSQNSEVQTGGHLYAYISNTYCENPSPIIVSEEKIMAHAEKGNPLVSKNSFFNIYPNPTTGDFTLELLDNEESSILLVEIFCMQGNLITRKELPAQSLHDLSLAQRQPGIYLIHVLSGLNIETGKIINQ